ncbi:MAG: SUMF1/EgtB/PvdO family nonheme iron enzyme [Polyangiaceae bacterium]|nr:SUMF1/EgtB/PvdO family nonheme iron enzyme [Polyangiaceae bacterium]
MFNTRKNSYIRAYCGSTVCLFALACGRVDHQFGKDGAGGDPSVSGAHTNGNVPASGGTLSTSPGFGGAPFTILGSGGAPLVPATTGGAAPTPVATGGMPSTSSTSSAGGAAGGGGAGGLLLFECTSGTKRCAGNAVQTCEAGTWQTPVECGASAPICSGAGVCGVPPSCEGLVNTCGPASNAACCASPVVPGGTFDRSNDGTHPATVSDFRLDTYEVTVGRFRKFVAVFTQDMISAGAGKNPNNGSDPGWDPNWNTQMSANAIALEAALKCSGTTWTDAPGANENLPADCMNWYEANAFCIWDGGRLPTQTEWNYAAAAGTEQRQYPWSNPAGSTAIDCSYANYMGAANGTAYCVSPEAGAPNRVGSESPKGDGKWGQADLAGNIDEWNLDWLGTYKNPCTNCANFTPGIGRILSGSAFNHPASALLTSYQGGNHSPEGRSANFGVRCARLQ